MAPFKKELDLRCLYAKMLPLDNRKSTMRHFRGSLATLPVRWPLCIECRVKLGIVLAIH